MLGMSTCLSLLTGAHLDTVLNWVGTSRCDVPARAERAERRTSRNAGKSAAERGAWTAQRAIPTKNSVKMRPVDGVIEGQPTGITKYKTEAAVSLKTIFWTSLLIVSTSFMAFAKYVEFKRAKDKRLKLLQGAFLIIVIVCLIASMSLVGWNVFRLLTTTKPPFGL